MQRKMLRAKIHRARVTAANLEYEGSITIPPSFMQAADLYEYEAVSVWNVTRGTRFETYVIKGRVEGEICVNGAAAHLVDPDDIVIIAAFVYMDEKRAVLYNPLVVFINHNNNIIDIRREIAA